MSKISREEFLRSAVASSEQDYDIREDKVFQATANKKLPHALRTYHTLATYTGAWGEAQAIHLIRRTMFGVKRADVNTLKNMTMSQAVDAMLNTAPPALSPPLNNYSTLTNLDTTLVLPGQPWVNAGYGDGNINFQRQQSFRAWWMSKIITQNLSIHERMVMFWHHLLATEIDVVDDARFVYKHNALLRQHATGNFKTLIRQVTTDPAMLRYLNGTYNTKYAPDENYARELQELFTVGKGPDSHYTEDDVKAAAKVLTGWKANATNINSTFDAASHDTTNKHFSGFYNGQIIQGQTGAAGANETDQLIDMIFTRNEVAKYICRRIYRFFVYYSIDQDVEMNVITPLSQIFMNANWEIKPVLSALFKSEHFWDMDSVGCYIKTPVDFVAGMMRQFNTIVFPPPTLLANYSLANQYNVWLYLFNQATFMNQELGNPPNVSGWPAFYQTPEYYEIWINSATLPKRLKFVSDMIQYGFNIGGTNFKINPLTFAQQFSTPENPDALIDQFISHLLGLSVSTTKRDYLKSILLTGQVNNYYWTSAWNNYINTPSNTTYAGIVNTRLTNLLLEMMRMAEHHLA